MRNSDRTKSKKHFTTPDLIVLMNELKAKEIIRLATLAPSGHNSQPWRFEVEEHVIRILPDLDRELVAVDPDHRELFFSLGCTAENIRIAATRFCHDSTWRMVGPEGGVHHVEVALEPVNPDVLPDSLSLLLESRQSNRSVYLGARISDDILDQVRAVPLERGVTLRMHGFGSAGFEAIRSAVLSGNEIQMSDPAFREELLDWIRFNRRQAGESQDGLTNRVMGAPPAHTRKP